MTRDEARGQAALANLDKYTQPKSVFIGSDGVECEKLYALEQRRTDLVQECAKQWMKVIGIPQEEYWFVGVPQALHDALEAFQTQCGIVAAEAFLKRHGWTVTRPVAELDKTG